MHHARGSNEGARAHTQEILCCQSPSPAVFALPRAPMASPTLPLITRRACTRSRARILGSRCICRGHACSSLNIILVGGAVALRPRSVGVGVKEVCRFRNQRLGNITDQRQILHQPPQGAGRDATPFPLAGAQQCGPKVDRQDLHKKTKIKPEQSQGAAALGEVLMLFSLRQRWHHAKLSSRRAFTQADRQEERKRFDIWHKTKFPTRLRHPHPSSNVQPPSSKSEKTTPPQQKHNRLTLSYPRAC